MLDLLYSDTVTLRRAKPGTRGLSGEAELVEVLDTDGSQILLKCRIEARGRRIIDSKGTELKSDATMIFRADGKIAVLIEDLVVTKDGRAWRIIGLETVRALFGAGDYARADLQRTNLPVPKDKHTYG